MSKAITGFFRTPGEAERAVQRLYDGGFPRDEVSLVAGDRRGHETPAVGPVVDSGAEVEAGRDAWVGGAIGLVAGALATVLPGIGAVIAIGPLAGLIGGASVGAAAGGVIGILKEHGISDEEAEFFAEGVKRGGAIVTLHGVPDDREGDARKILKEAGAIDTEELAKEWRRGVDEDTPKVKRAG